MDQIEKGRQTPADLGVVDNCPSAKSVGYQHSGNTAWLLRQILRGTSISKLVKERVFWKDLDFFFLSSFDPSRIESRVMLTPATHL